MPATWAKMAKNLPTYDVTQKKKETKNFFLVLTWRLAESSESLNSSLAQFPGKLWSC